MGVRILKSEVTEYVATDGRVFDDLALAEYHEKELMIVHKASRWERTTSFLLTAQHLAAIKQMNVWWELKNLIPCFHSDSLRPFGNSDVYGDLADIMGISPPDWEVQDEWPESDISAMIDFACTLPAALQIVMSGHNKPGRYKRENYIYGEWEPA